MKTLVALLVALIFAVGCVVTETIENSPTTARLAVQYGTLKYIGSDAEKAARVNERVEEVRSSLSSDSITVSILDEQLRAQIDWGSMDPADQLLLRALLDELKNTLEERIGEGLLSPESRVTLTRVADWIQEVAR